MTLSLQSDFSAIFLEFFVPASVSGRAETDVVIPNAGRFINHSS